MDAEMLREVQATGIERPPRRQGAKDFLACLASWRFKKGSGQIALRAAFPCDHCVSSATTALKLFMCHQPVSPGTRAFSARIIAIAVIPGENACEPHAFEVKGTQ